MRNEYLEKVAKYEYQCQSCGVWQWYQENLEGAEKTPPGIGLNAPDFSNSLYLLARSVKQWRLVNNTGARLGLKSQFSQPKKKSDFKSSRKELYKIWINKKEKCKLTRAPTGGRISTPPPPQVFSR